MGELIDALSRHADQADVQLVSQLGLYAGASERVGDLLGTKNFFTRMRNNMKTGLGVRYYILLRNQD